MPSYSIFLLIGLTLIALGTAMYYLANIAIEYNIPKGATWIGLGPHNNMTPIGTRMVYSVDLPHDWIDLQVSFNFTEFKKYHIYITMPYQTLQVSPYVDYITGRYYNETSQIGNITAHFENYETKGSSVINATFNPSKGFPFIPNEPVKLSIRAKVSGLTSITHPLGSKHTVILTFFGDQTGVWDAAMGPYIGINTHAMVDYPFQATIQFPRENYLSFETFPNPIELFITERFRSAIFELDFSHEIEVLNRLVF